MDLNNKIFLFAQFDEVSSKNVVSRLLEMADSGVKNAEIYINSYGGYITDLFAITDTIDKVRTDKGMTVTTIAVGAAQSAGAYLMMYGDTRYASKNVEILTHGVQSMQWGNTESFKETVKQMEAIDLKFAGMVSDATGITKEKALELLKQDETFTADEALKYGFIDAIWEDEKQINELEEYITDKMAADSKPNTNILEASNFLQSVKFSSKSQKQENNKEGQIMADELNAKSVEVDLKASRLENKTMKAEYDNKITDLTAKLEAKTAEIDKFYEDRKNDLIASVVNVVSEDKKAEVKADLEGISELPFEKFKGFAEKYANAYSKAVVTGKVDLNKNKKADARTAREKEIDAALEGMNADQGYTKESYGQGGR